MRTVAPGLLAEGRNSSATVLRIVPDLSAGTGGDSALPPEGNAESQDPTTEKSEASCSARISVIVLDDDDLARVMLIAALSGTSNIEIVGAFADAETAIKAARRLRPQVAVLEVELPGALDGIQTGLLLRREFQNIGIVWLSAHKRPYLPVSFQVTKRWAYLLKTSEIDVGTIAAAIDGVANGLVVLDPEVAATMNRLRNNWISWMSTVEHDVLALMAQGLSNAGIAQVLNVPEQYVRRHVNHIYRHLGVSARAGGRDARVEAVLAYLRGGEMPARASEPQLKTSDTLGESFGRSQRTDTIPPRPVLDQSAFMERLHQEIARCLRTRRHLSVALLSATVPDSAASEEPAMGPETLRPIADELARHIRRYDLVAVAGAAEVVLMFPEATLESTKHILGRLRTATPTPREWSALWGVATWPTDGNDPTALLEAARHRVSAT